MKRLRLLIWSGGLSVLLLAPFGVGLTPSGLNVRPQAATAGTEDILKADADGVCVAIPVLNPATQALPKTAKCPSGVIPNDQRGGGAIIYYLKQILFLINTLVGSIIILVIIIAGIQYITSAADPARVKSAKERIMHAVIALILYLLMVAILNFLVPGGVL